MLPRSKVEKSIRKILTEEVENEQKGRVFALILAVIMALSLIASMIVPYII